MDPELRSKKKVSLLGKFMYYVTFPAPRKVYQITFNDILYGISDQSRLLEKKDTRDTVTYEKEKIRNSLSETYPFDIKISDFYTFCKKYEPLLRVKSKSSLYHTFSIPKRSGGLREINAPLPDLMQALKELKNIFEGVLYSGYHTNAFAYIRGRCHKDALVKHQRNKSKWFLKLDFHNFFGSTTPTFLISQLSKVYPFCEMIERERNPYLEQALSLCFLNDGLPQGTPMSPMLTNLMMIPIDYRISKYAKTHSPHLVYTRYADDICISSDRFFDRKEVSDSICKILSEFNAPFSLNTKKTRFGSSSGRNWNLGLMLNKDNEITVGHARKKNYTHMIHSFLLDYKSGVRWSVEDTQKLSGLTSYYKSIQEDVFSSLIGKYSQRIGVDLYAAMKDIISSGV